MHSELLPGVQGYTQSLTHRVTSPHSNLGKVEIALSLELTKYVQILVSFSRIMALVLKLSKLQFKGPWNQLKSN